MVTWHDIQLLLLLFFSFIHSVMNMLITDISILENNSDAFWSEILSVAE